jgi:hypothetical protein
MSVAFPFGWLGSQQPDEKRLENCFQELSFNELIISIL